jgi:hypothetical protein
MQRFFLTPAASRFNSNPNPSSVPAYRHAGPMRRRRKRSHAPWHIRLATLFLCVLMSAHAAFAQSSAQCAPSNSPTNQNSIAAFVSESAQRFGLPVSWIEAVIHVESLGQPHVVSPKGAMGLMQIMPDTWAILRVRYGLGDDPCDPHDNIMAGVAYLRQMYDRYGPAGFLAAFNAGPGRYENFLTTGRPLPQETRAYLAKLGYLIGDGQAAGTVLANNDPLVWMRSPMFVGPVASISNHRAANSQPSIDTHSSRIPTNRSIAQTFALAPQSSGLFVRDAGTRELP